MKGLKIGVSTGQYMPNSPCAEVIVIGRMQLSRGEEREEVSYPATADLCV